MSSADPSRKSTLEHPLPSHSFKVHDSAILSLAFFQLPPRHSEGLVFQEGTSAEEQGFVHDGLPHLVMSCGLDLGARFSDLDDGGVSVGSQKSRRGKCFTRRGSYRCSLLIRQPFSPSSSRDQSLATQLPTFPSSPPL